VITEQNISQILQALNSEQISLLIRDLQVLGLLSTVITSNNIRRISSDIKPEEFSAFVIILQAQAYLESIITAVNFDVILPVFNSEQIPAFLDTLAKENSGRRHSTNLGSLFSRMSPSSDQEASLAQNPHFFQNTR
jgi:hypothetical protein